MSSKNLIHFGPFEVTDQVFYKTPLCYALVNIKPILPGHVLVIPYRQAKRLTDLTSEEISDLFTAVQKVQRMLAVKASGNNEGDGIYDRLQSEEGNVGGGLWDQQRPVQDGKFPKIKDEDRKPRSPEDMNEEALVYQKAMALLDNE
ncbi:hypothetical protein G7Y89_g2214 [Cudoniella acicularis]|uniref:HIT domain-containing protein n=1 Tax=Cudoniella acicularis TaxID=354080 RepID=A0A8H4RWQ2_9HELO|nr:hypothetical protein G7Y89_g2214 [Cudoniella acicularis]